MQKLKLDPVVVDGYNIPKQIDVANEEKVIPDDGAEIAVAQDHVSGLVLIFHGGGSDGKVTIKAGNGCFAGGDYAFDVPNGKRVVICPESGRFKNMDGENKGKIIIESSTDGIGVSAYLLPLK